jgi:hypothetical protein
MIAVCSIEAETFECSNGSPEPTSKTAKVGKGE